MPLKNLWHLYSLAESPFFQQDLQGGSRYPIDLFVGRDEEAARLLGVIGGSRSSRQTVEALPGFGKTTLTQYVKAKAATEGYLSYPDPVSAAGADSADTLLARLLSHVYDAFASQAGHKVLKEGILDEARRMILDTRVRDVKVAASLAGFGFDRDVSQRTERAAFRSALLMIPPLLRDLSDVAREHGFSGIIVHMNNLENLVTDAERTRAGSVMRDLRDVFLLDGYHFVLVGTPEAVRAIISPHAQLRGVFGVSRPLEPLSEDAFERLLARRYAHLRVNDGPARPPVQPEAARALYRVFRGDLRGTLRALDAGAQELIGLTDPPGAPIREAELMSVLGPILAAEAEATLSETLLGYLYALKEWDGAFTQRELTHVWKLSQGAVSQNLRELQRLGYVEEQRRVGRLATYSLTGTSRILLGTGT
ncbi:MAG: winged helix-turn-helix transcriptional regulator [Gemmatimonadetes bacterium]|nr:winged helix-turn-helix transcriptional regulator [Gemmatimonadota bacterium]